MLIVPSVLWRCWLGGRKGIRPVNTEWWGTGVVICLDRCADLHMSQLMPLPLTVSCSSRLKSRLVLPFWYRLTQVVLEKRPLNGSSSSSSYVNQYIDSYVTILPSLPTAYLWPLRTCVNFREREMNKNRSGKNACTVANWFSEKLVNLIPPDVRLLG